MKLFESFLKEIEQKPFLKKTILMRKYGVSYSMIRWWHAKIHGTNDTYFKGKTKYQRQRRNEKRSKIL